MTATMQPNATDIRIDGNTNSTIIGNAIIIHLDGVAVTPQLLGRIADALAALSKSMTKQQQRRQ